MHKCLRIFSHDGIDYETINDPTEQDILRTIEAITERVQAGVECIYAILDRDDHCYTQLAAEEDGYHVEWRETFVHWWQRDTTKKNGSHRLMLSEYSWHFYASSASQVVFAGTI